MNKRVKSLVVAAFFLSSLENEKPCDRQIEVTLYRLYANSSTLKFDYSAAISSFIMRFSSTAEDERMSISNEGYEKEGKGNFRRDQEIYSRTYKYTHTHTLTSHTH